MERLDDPLNDPLPGGSHPSPWFRSSAGGQAGAGGSGGAQAGAGEGAGAAQGPAAGPAQGPGAGATGGAVPPDGRTTSGRGRRRKPPQAPGTGATDVPVPSDDVRPTGRRRAPARDDETVGLRVAPHGIFLNEDPDDPDGPAVTGAGRAAPPAVPQPRHDETMALRTGEVRRRVSAISDAVGGRAARRKAAKQRGGGSAAEDEGTGTAEESENGGAPLSRVAARRAAKARKPSPSVVASRAIGEFFITLGVVMLLFVTYQLWWTNIRAQAQARGEREDLKEGWAEGKRRPDTFEPGQGFAIMYIPKLDVEVPIAEGISKKKVLDRGMVGHYGGEGTIQTAMPEDAKGNFSVAGHRNTHGEPFRYINRLEPGDPIVVETQDKYFVYKMASILRQTPPSNTSVIAPVPNGSGFTKPGRYITLTTCTPEFTSTYRMIVWGKMVEERPRSKGKPDALVG
ncbi:class E sortase [Streptomyces sp. NA04227]|uniref:class E sortase n=1 Tax=Streptomyces sp. NA04227 TaxID=2742136 RepID=UPI0020CA5F17|nr:class E sortase [Streptomyces sp. NA04227]